MKKIVRIALVFILILWSVGCNEKQEKLDDVLSDETGALNGKIDFVTWNGPQEESLRNAIKGFNKIYPGIEVNLQITPWSEYWTKLEAAATNNDMPDVITNHVIYSQVYAQAGMLLPLEEKEMQKYDPNFSYSNYVDGVTNIYKYKEKHYGVPKDVDCIVLAYNKELFDQAGVNYPTDNWSWNDLLAAAEKLTDKEKGIYGFAAYNNIQEGYGSYIYQNEGYILSPDKTSSGLALPETKEALELYLDMIYRYEYSPTTAQLAETDRRTMFASGKVAMLNVGNWQLSNFVSNEEINTKFDIAPLAQINNEPTNISNGLAHSVATSSKNPEAAKAFVAYLGSKEGAELMAIGPAVPVYKGIDKVWAEIHKNEFDTNVVVRSIQHGIPYPSTLTRSKWEAAINVYIEKIFNGEMTIEEGLEQAADEMNQFLLSEEK